MILSGVLLISAEETDPADRKNMEEQEYTGNEPDNPEEADQDCLLYTSDAADEL